MNLHTPDRGANEPFAAYRVRRAASNDILKSLKRGPHQTPARNKFDVSRFFLGQHTTTAARRMRRSCVALIGIRQYKRLNAEPVLA